MTNSEDTGSPRWRSASLIVQTTEDAARAVAAAASAASAVRSPRPSAVFSSNEDSTSHMQKLQKQFSRVIKGFSTPVEVKRATYNPEVLTSQKRQWARFQLQSLDHRSMRDPSRLFESMVVVGLHPNTDIQALEKKFSARKSELPGKLRSALGVQNQARVEPSLEPQVLFVYPPEKQLPLKYKDLLSFCFPGGVEVHSIERTPSMSELNEILLGQEHLKQSDQSFVFRLQVADDSTLYGCCMLVEEVVHKPSGLISTILEKQPFSPLTRNILTTRRCYCIISRLPFFYLHFSILNSIFTEERLERVLKSIDMLNFQSLEYNNENDVKDKYSDEEVLNAAIESSDPSTEDSTPRRDDDEVKLEHQVFEGESDVPNGLNNFDFVSPVRSGTHSVDEFTPSKQAVDNAVPGALLPLLQYQQYESLESSSSFQGLPIEERNFRSVIDEAEVEEASSSGQDDFSDHSEIFEWAKANNHGSLQIICEYYRVRCPARGTALTFCPLDHLHPLEFKRPGESFLHIAGSKIDLKSCNTSLELSEARSALLTEEEATTLSVWTIACICGSLRLENVLTMFAAALLEKQIVIICSNLGILSASVLSIIPLIRPFQWQSLLMPVLPNDMLDFLDAPVPYIVGIKNKSSEVSKLSNAILVDANKNQVRSPTLPQLPKHKELFSSLSPYHAKLVGESYLGRRRPVYECTDVQIEAAREFLAVLRTYLDSLCSNLRSHTITNVQSNDDKVSLLLKESFIDSFPSRDKPFMKLFVDTQLFSVHTDLVLSLYQKD